MKGPCGDSFVPPGGDLLVKIIDEGLGFTLVHGLLVLILNVLVVTPDFRLLLSAEYLFFCTRRERFDEFQGPDLCTQSAFLPI